MITVNVRLFNKLQKYSPDKANDFKLEMIEGSHYLDLLQYLNIPEKEVFLAFRNSNNTELYCRNFELENNETIALSGPIPFINE